MFLDSEGKLDMTWKEPLKLTPKAVKFRFHENGKYQEITVSQFGTDSKFEITFLPVHGWSLNLFNVEEKEIFNHLKQDQKVTLEVDIEEHQDALFGEGQIIQFTPQLLFISCASPLKQLER